MSLELSNPLQLLSTISQRQKCHAVEWSIKITHNTVRPRYKPTLYIYPDEQQPAYRSLTQLLHTIKTPRTVLDIHDDSRFTAMYQGLRLPVAASEDNCLFIHDSETQFIHSYRWREEKSFQQQRYMYSNRLPVTAVRDHIHPDLHSIFDSLLLQDGFKDQLGIWCQKKGDITHEVYLTFPSRPKIDWVIAGISPLLTASGVQQLQSYKGLRFKNIGFDAVTETRAPAVTMYFTIPVSDYFPTDYKDLMKRTFLFFREETESILPEHIRKVSV
ncbi:hypothetical protein HN014_17665 [Aquimarina sp. TRL1]|uniref:hypothetical protein n=1 Tax=Aquimarina sp. (strain TRL1) TaxID=2736252 RepID=UPI00158E6919|nr:hypothetical protein [Aquimarina sp. TRL1]QKX06664.1 hypothetical protein HN014_17665 [Aquimarina sp. TRL1]